MEQQYSNQRYLDKLRSDNETLTLLEKERQVKQYNIITQVGTFENVSM